MTEADGVTVGKQDEAKWNGEPLEGCCGMICVACPDITELTQQRDDLLAKVAQLETAALFEDATKARERDRLQAERDDLLAALEKAAKRFCVLDDGHEGPCSATATRLMHGQRVCGKSTLGQYAALIARVKQEAPRS